MTNDLALLSTVVSLKLAPIMCTSLLLLCRAVEAYRTPLSNHSRPAHPAEPLSQYLAMCASLCDD